MRVRKRSGDVQPFDVNRIKRSIVMAFNSVNQSVNVTPILNEVGDALRQLPQELVTVEIIQDAIEEVLMDNGHYEAAKSFIEYRTLRAKYRNRRLRPDNMEIARYIHAAKYGKYLVAEKRRETFEETVERNIQMHLRRWPHLESPIRSAYEQVLARRVLPSMRSFQFAGPAIEAHNARMYNCSFTLVDRPEVFGQIFYLLLCGCGVGYSVQWHHVEKLPAIGKTGRQVWHHHIADSIEGWADAATALVNMAIQGIHVEFDFSAIRPEGTPLVTSGGKAPGHLPLKRALEACREILLTAQGRKLRPIEAHDMICHLADAVLSGGIRRSSLISLFSLHDTEMLYAKTAGAFDPSKGVNTQRCMANNSAVLFRDRTSRADFDRIIRLSSEGYGEPGFFFTNSDHHGTNPCGEIGLNPILRRMINNIERLSTGFGFCNLEETNMAACTSEAEAHEAVRSAAFIGTLQAAYTDFPYLGKTTEEICRRDALIGVSMTGMMDNPELALNPKVQRALAESVTTMNLVAAKMIGINPAARCTCVKPSGTASLELGAIGAGIHPRHARRYFRRVTGNVLEGPVKIMMRENPQCIERKPNGDVAIVFPIEAGSSALVGKNMDALTFMDLVQGTYENWILPGITRQDDGLTHNVSCTVTVKPEEAIDVVDRVWERRATIAALAFAPPTIDKLYPFAPNEEVTTEADETHWNNVIACWKSVDWSKAQEEEDVPDHRQVAACEGAKCESGILPTPNSL